MPEVAQTVEPAVETERQAKIKAIIEKVVASYPSVDKMTPSSFVVFDDTLDYIGEYILQACHANLKYVKAGKIDQIITGVAKDKPLDINYIQWLIAGPFRSFKDRIHLETVEHKGKERYYLRCTHLDTWPSNVIYNFCIATRISTEYPDVIRLWGKLNYAGVDLGLAFMVATKVAFYGHGDDAENPWDWTLPGLQNNTGHYWIDPLSDWRKVMEGEPLVSKFSNSYKAAPSKGIPSNIIWGQGQQAELSSLPSKTVKQLSDHFGFTQPVFENPCLEVPLITTEPMDIEAIIAEADDEDDIEFHEWLEGHDPFDDIFN